MYGEAARNLKDSPTPMLGFFFFFLGCFACTLRTEHGRDTSGVRGSGPGHAGIACRATTALAHPVAQRGI